jgi:hypothetical protein
MCCVLIGERVVSKIRERECEEEILQLYNSQLSFERSVIKIFRPTTGFQYIFLLTGMVSRARIYRSSFRESKPKMRVFDD